MVLSLVPFAPSLELGPSDSMWWNHTGADEEQGQAEPRCLSSTREQTAVGGGWGSDHHISVLAAYRAVGERWDLRG